MIVSFRRGSIYGDDFDEAVRFTSVAGLTTRREHALCHRATREELCLLDGTENGNESQKTSHFHQMALTYSGPVFRAQYGRRVFRTQKGYIGTGPAGMLAGDEVCFLLGGRRPMWCGLGVVRGGGCL